MPFDLEQTIALLTRTPATLNALLRDLPEPWATGNEGEKTWNAFDIIGHLIHSERANWITRAKTILEHGEGKIFEPLDREGHARDIQGKSMPELLDEFARVRAENIRELRALNPNADNLQLRGRHPSFGVVTLSQLLATWASHDLTHLHQLTRVMANQYRDEVGPWSVFLGVLKCTGHSEQA